MPKVVTLSTPVCVEFFGSRVLFLLVLYLHPFGPITWIFDFAEHLRLDIRIFHPGQTVLKEGEYGEMTYILVHGEASCLVSVSVDFGP